MIRWRTFDCDAPYLLIDPRLHQTDVVRMLIHVRTKDLCQPELSVIDGHRLVHVPECLESAIRCPLCMIGDWWDDSRIVVLVSSSNDQIYDNLPIQKVSVFSSSISKVQSTKNLSAQKYVARYDALSHSFSSWNLRITYPLNIMYTIFLIIFDEDLIHTCACASFTQIWRRTNKCKRGQKYWYGRKQTQVIHDSVIRKDMSRYYREGSPSHKKNINTQKKVRKKCQSECNPGVITNDTYWNNVILKKNNSIYIYMWIHDKYEQIFLSRKRHR